MCHVLVRLTSSVDGNSADPFKGQTRMFFEITSLDSNRPPRIVRPKPVGDQEFANNGWSYLLLEPGDYHVVILTHFSPFTSRNYKPETFRLYVPRAHLLAYAGSFHTSSHREAWSWNAGAYGRHFITLNKMQFDFEPSLANEVARKEFEALGTLKSTRLQPENEFSSECPFSELGELAVMTRATDALEPPHWISRAANDYINTATVAGGPGAIGAYVMAYDLAALPFAATIGAIEGKHSKKKWAGCVDELSREFVDFHFATQLQNTLLERLQTIGPAGLHTIDPGESLDAQVEAKAYPYILCAEARNSALSQGKKRGQVGLDTRLRFRLFDTQAEECLFDRAFSPECKFREMKEFAGESGRVVFRNDLTVAVQSGVEWLVQQVMTSK
jgi:hypothetical protein